MTDAEDEEAKIAPRVYETLPRWAENVRPLDSTLKLPPQNREFQDSFDDERYSPELREKSILYSQPSIHSSR